MHPGSVKFEILKSLCLPQQYLEFYIELSAQIPEGGIGRPILWDTLGVKFFEDT